jgi:hypothetical protein
MSADNLRYSNPPQYLIVSIRDRLFCPRYLVVNSTPFSGALRVVSQSFQSLLNRPVGDGLNFCVGFGADGLADQILGRNASRLGFDIAGLAADLGTVNLQNPDLGANGRYGYR